LTITGTGFTGIGTTAPTSTLHVAGTLKYVDGNQVNGKVLTTDGSGNATWQDISSRIFILPVYADDAAAGAGGLIAGRLYRTAAGVVMVKL
jgi:hypothetical protein